MKKYSHKGILFHWCYVALVIIDWNQHDPNIGVGFPLYKTIVAFHSAKKASNSLRHAYSSVPYIDTPRSLHRITFPFCKVVAIQWSENGTVTKTLQYNLQFDPWPQVVCLYFNINSPIIVPEILSKGVGWQKEREASYRRHSILSSQRTHCLSPQTR